VVKIAYILPLASIVYLLISSWWVHQFFKRRVVPTDNEFLPPVSLLKPVRGLDQGAYENFASFCRQNYPVFELLFATDDPADPAIPVIEQVARDFPAANVRLFVTAPQTVPNPKASCMAALSKHAAAHPIVVLSDSDMRVGPDYLRRVVSPLADPTIGLVTCGYRGVRPVTFTAKLEALYMGVTFLPQVVVARRFLDMQFALGATMALRVADLEASGGWEAAGYYLAEDTRVARQIVTMGKKVVLSDYLVDSYLGPTSWREQWHREVRWARTNRGNRPREYAGLIVTLTVPLALIYLPLDPAGVWGWTTVAAALVVRWATAWSVAGDTGNNALRRWLPWLPLRDLLSALIWCAGAVGRKVVWRGRIHRVHKDGRLDSLEPETAAKGRAAGIDFRTPICSDSGVVAIADDCEEGAAME
jgi:ceramide glucosyltransferase